MASGREGRKDFRENKHTDVWRKLLLRSQSLFTPPPMEERKEVSPPFVQARRANPNSLIQTPPVRGPEDQCMFDSSEN